MITSTIELQQQIHRLSCLDGYTKVGAAEVEQMLCRYCESEPHAWAVVQQFIETSRNYPRPVEVREMITELGPPESAPAPAQIHRLSCLSGYTKVGAAELEYTLSRCCVDAKHIHEVIQHFLDRSRQYPCPVDAMEIAEQLRPLSAKVSIHDPTCQQCNGSGFIGETRLIDGEELSYSRRCPGPSILVNRKPGEYHEPSLPAQRRPISPEEQAELAEIFTSPLAKQMPAADPLTPAPLWLTLQEDPNGTPHVIINGEAAAMQKRQQIEELERRFGGIEPA